jgi:GTPase
MTSSTQRPLRKTGSSVPVIVLLGRPNVGKSTLFNRLCQNRRAITSPVPGTTRDWLEGTAHWGKFEYKVIDTGGYTPGGDGILAAVRGQVEKWAQDADAVLWMVDGQAGLTPEDSRIARWLRPRSRDVTVVVNKVDAAGLDPAAAEFHRLGFPHVIGISASHGRRVNTLLDHLENHLQPAVPVPVGDRETARVAIVGRPNVGKSSLLNRFIGEERALVSDLPGTTRDVVDTLWQWEGKRFLFMDTAGLRSKKSVSSEGLEGLTRLMAEKALGRCEVALLVLDASEGLLEGDTAVGLLIQEKSRACVVAVNKWDVVQERARFLAWYKEHQATDLPFLAWAPLVFISAKTGYNVPALADALWNAHLQYHRRFEADDLEAFFWGQIQARPYSHRGRKLVFHGAEQVGQAPPVISVRGNMLHDEVHFSYQRHLENVFRRHYGVEGTPLVLRFTRRRK